MMENWIKRGLIMNIFKRELKIFIRSRLFQILFTISILSLALWIVVGLNIFNLNSLDIVSIYNILPIILSLIIPLLSYNYWQRERRYGLDEIILKSTSSINQVILYKVLCYISIFSLVLILCLPMVLIFIRVGFIDIGQLFSINLGLFIFIIFSVSLTLLLSVIIRGRVVTIITGILVLILISYNNNILMSFYTGVVKLRDIVFVIIISYLFILISILIISRKWNIKIIVVFVILIMSGFIPGRLDLTSLRSHTLTDYSKNIILTSKSSFELYYYYSSEIKRRSTLPEEIIGLLDQFNQVDGFQTHYISDNDSDFEAAVRKYKPDRYGGSSFYNFIVIKYKDHSKVIPLLPYVETLEFEILKVIHYFLNNGLKSVGIYIGNEEYTEDNFSELSLTLEEHFHTVFLFPGDIIPDYLDGLLVIGHFGINSRYTRDIGHYLSLGGNLILAGNGLPTSHGLIYRETPILEALKDCGIIIEPYLIGDKHSIKVKDNNGHSVEYPLNVITYPNRELKGNSIVDPFTGFTGIYLSPVLALADQFKNILYTSKEAWLVDSITGLDGVPEGEFSVAVYGEGHFSESFTGIPSSAENRLMVLGNSMSLTNYLASIDTDNGYDFIIRSLYSIVGYEDLIKIRHKYNWEKTFFKIERSLYRESVLYIIKTMILYIYPLFILIILTIIRKKNY